MSEKVFKVINSHRKQFSGENGIHRLSNTYMFGHLQAQGWSISWNTVECRYNAVQYNMILHTSMQRPRQSINHSWNPQNNPIPRPNGRAMGCILWGFGWKLMAWDVEHYSDVTWVSLACNYCATACPSWHKMLHKSFVLLDDYGRIHRRSMDFPHKGP